jgi:hypothetical protein
MSKNYLFELSDKATKPCKVSCEIKCHFHMSHGLILTKSLKTFGEVPLIKIWSILKSTFCLTYQDNQYVTFTPATLNNSILQHFFQLHNKTLDKSSSSVEEKGNAMFFFNLCLIQIFFPSCNAYDLHFVVNFLNFCSL